jgi:adenylyltransferase/sulfurtransferase
MTESVPLHTERSVLDIGCALLGDMAMAESSIPQITPSELKQKMDAGEEFFVVDVREKWELAIAALPFARHIRMIEILARQHELPREVPIVVMCRTGSRSSRTIEMLQLHGFTNLLNLDGGILAWAREVDPSLPEFYA